MTSDHKAFVERMVTKQRAETVALRLFPEEYADGTDCRAETGRLGQPCTICAARNEYWLSIIAKVRDAMCEAFR